MQEKTESKMGRPPRQTPDIKNKADIPLNASEKLFVHQFLLSGDLKESARKMGSDAKDLTKAGSKILNRPNVKKAISEGQKEYIVQAAVEKAEVILMFRKNWMMALEKGDIKAANEAAKFLGQACPDMFHAPQKKDGSEVEGGSAKTVVETSKLKAIEAFATSDDAFDVESDLEDAINRAKSKDLGMDDFKKSVE